MSKQKFYNIRINQEKQHNDRRINFSLQRFITIDSKRIENPVNIRNKKDSNRHGCHDAYFKEVTL
jgi:hypothetical protein